MNLQALKADINFLCGATSATYLNSDKVRNMNVEFQRVATLIWESDGTWNYDDSNNTDSPIAYRTIANASATYVIPTTALRIEGVEIKNNTGSWFKLLPISYQDFMNTKNSPESYRTGTGLPSEYWLEGNEIRLFPAPGTGSVTMSSGMAVRLSRAVTELGVSATSTVPGFVTSFHRILSLAAAIDFTQDDRQRNFLVAQREKLEKGLIRFYSKRADDYKTVIKPRARRRWASYT